MAGINSLHPRRSCHWKPALESHLDVLRDGAYSDVTFIVGPPKERIPAHQIFLKTRSPVFEVMFSERWNEDTNKEVPLEDVDPKIFRKFLRYIYTDSLEAKVSEALELLQIAHRYDVQMLVSKCEELMESKVALDDAVDVFQAARKYDKIQLMDKVGDFMATSMPKFQSHPSFSRVDKQFFMYILKRNDLKMKEVDVFRLALKWAKNQHGFTVEEAIEDVLPLIRFPTMTPNEFTTAVVPTGLLSQSTIVELFMYFGSDSKTRKSMASTLKYSTERRQPPDSAISFYSRDFYDCKLKRENYRCLSDRIEFDIYKFHGPFGLFTALYALFISIPNIALSSISLYCPIGPPCTTENSDWEVDLTKTFKIVVAAKGSTGDFQEVLVLPAIKAQEGAITEVKFLKDVPLDSWQRYSITVEEIPNAEGYIWAQVYEVRDFGKIRGSASTAIGESWAYVRNICNWRYRSFAGSYSSAQLIHKLGLKEIL